MEEWKKRRYSRDRKAQVELQNLINMIIITFVYTSLQCSQAWEAFKYHITPRFWRGLLAPRVIIE